MSNSIPIPSVRLPEQESAHTEPFVTPAEAAVFLRCAPVTVKRLAREGKIPAHSIHNGIRKRWRFLISELAISMKKEVSSDRSSTPLSQPKERGKAV
ncbi:MAG TPA: helix-turn-helix domain-containing protein [Edaphobacter sp.]|nr:helix-turn-helix domain-containing protein [Edaphobacter sp.]